MQSPKELKPSELFEALAATPRPHRIIDFPRYDQATGEPVARVAIWVLSQGEQMLAAAEAEAYTRAKLKEAIPGTNDARRGYDDIYNNAAAVEVLFRALRKKDDLSKSAFATPKELRALSVDEIGVLFQEYLITQHQLGPIVTKMTEADLDMWLARLKEGADAIPFARLSLETLIDLIGSLASRVLKSSTANSSSGSPVDDGSPSATQEPDQPTRDLTDYE